MVAILVSDCNRRQSWGDGGGGGGGGRVREQIRTSHIY